MPGEISLGIGDDCAVVQAEAGSLLVTVDAMAEGTHFPAHSPPRLVGQRAVRAAVSDIAAMGGIPVCCVVALLIPESRSHEDATECMLGAQQAGLELGAPVVGGDTCATQGVWTLSVTVVGRMDPEMRPVTRGGAKPGDLVIVTGPLGDSRVGLEHVRLGSTKAHGPVGSTKAHGPVGSTEEEFLQRFWLPVPRLREGQILAASPAVHAMLDVSDGLGQDLGHLCGPHGPGAVVQRHQVPVSDAMRNLLLTQPHWFLEAVVAGGEDFELLAAIDPSGFPEICRGFRDAGLSEPSVIGEFVVTPGVRLMPDNLPIQDAGFRHGEPSNRRRI